MKQNQINYIFSEALIKFSHSDFSGARKLWMKILEYSPSNISTIKNIMLTYHKENNILQTEKYLKKLLKIKFEMSDILIMLILNLEEQDKIFEAKYFIKEGIKQKLLNDHWRIQMITLCPIIKYDNEEIKYVRNEINRDITAFLKSDNNLNLNIDNNLVRSPHFAFSYDGFSNLEFNKKCVEFYRKVYPELNETYKLQQNNSKKIYIGFISDHLTDHTIGKLFKGIISKLNKTDFKVIIFHTERTKKGSILKDFLNLEKKDQIKNIFLKKGFKNKQNQILSECLDILFYPEIGISLELYFLSFIKLAKIQMTSWGHPETTGNNSIDYFLSSTLIESDNSKLNFSEILICSQSLPMFYYEPKIHKELNKDELNKKNMYSCPQSLFKIHPEFDKVIKKILDQDKKAIIYFLKDYQKTLYKKLLKRFKEKSKIDLSRIKFLDNLSWEEYVNHCGHASVLLDPLYFGAGNSFYESLYYGTPTITKPTSFTKSRLVLGAYNQMNIDDLEFSPIVNSLDEYANQAVEICNSGNLHKINQNLKDKTQKKIYENFNCVLDYEKTLKKINSAH